MVYKSNYGFIVRGISEERLGKEYKLHYYAVGMPLVHKLTALDNNPVICNDRDFGKAVYDLASTLDAGFRVFNCKPHRAGCRRKKDNDDDDDDEDGDDDSAYTPASEARSANHSKGSTSSRRNIIRKLTQARDKNTCEATARPGRYVNLEVCHVTPFSSNKSDAEQSRFWKAVNPLLPAPLSAEAWKVLNTHVGVDVLENTILLEMNMYKDIFKNFSYTLEPVASAELGSVATGFSRYRRQNTTQYAAMVEFLQPEYQDQLVFGEQVTVFKYDAEAGHTGLRFVLQTGSPKNMPLTHPAVLMVAAFLGRIGARLAVNARRAEMAVVGNGVGGGENEGKNEGTDEGRDGGDMDDNMDDAIDDDRDNDGDGSGRVEERDGSGAERPRQRAHRGQHEVVDDTWNAPGSEHNGIARMQDKKRVARDLFGFGV